MSHLESMIHYRRLIFSLVGILIAVGIVSFSSMARQEDPSFPYRAGMIRVIFPGGSPAQIEQLITIPLEEELAQIDEINEYTSNSRDDIAIINISLKDAVYDTDAAWTRVERAIERARNEFPQGVTLVDFDDRQIDLPVAVISLTGSDDLIELRYAAEKLKAILLTLPNVSRIEMDGQPEEEIVVKIEQGRIEQLGVSRDLIAQVIAARNTIISGGVVQADERSVRFNPQSDYRSVEQIADTLIPLSNGQSVALGSIADVALEPRTPLASMRFDDGVPTVSLGVIVTRGQTDVVKFGTFLRSKLAEVAADFAPLELRESFFQPDYVSERLSSLQGSLLVSVLIIAGVVFFALGWRTGLLVASVLPVVSLITLGLYNAGGGVFHQIAVIGIVISLGILIDNAIVVIEYIETQLRLGATRGEAIRDSVKAMAKPLLASTGTTIAAFIPLLLAEGGVGDFTRAIPTMIVIALSVSYVISVFVWPLLAFYWLRSRAERDASTQAVSTNAGLAIQWTNDIAVFCSRAVRNAPYKVLLIAGLSVLFSLSMAPSLKQQFFPSTDRNQMVIEIQMPQSTPVQVTEQVSREVEALVKQRDDVVRVYRAVGATGFSFYYNLGGQPDESHVARITVNTASGRDNKHVARWVRDELTRQFPQATLIARILGQGPPRPAPIELRIQHPDEGVLFEATQQVRALLASIDGVVDLRSNLDLGSPEVVLDIREELAEREGLSVSAVARSVNAHTRGTLTSQYRYGQDPVSIRVRSDTGEQSSVAAVLNHAVSVPRVGTEQGEVVPLGNMAAVTTRWASTNIRHHDGLRTAAVMAEIDTGAAFNVILGEFFTKLEAQPLAPGVGLSLGGDAAASSEANSNIATAVPLALAVLTFFMLYQFNSFRRIAIIFATIPLAAVGVIPGLALSGQPFGFQSLLGVIALVGIVVNNAIVLIDVLDQKLQAGDSIADAVDAALLQRTAPILLTTATTILGLLPLAFSSSTLWPPMAWAIISGLLLSTILTLVAIPALCLLLLGKHQNDIPAIERVTRPSTRLATWLILPVLVFTAAGFMDDQVALAQPSKMRDSVSNGVELTSEAQMAPESESYVIDLDTVLTRAALNLQVENAASQTRAAQADASAIYRRAWAPSVTLGGNVTRRDTVSNIDLPTGALAVGERDSHVYELKITQPLFRPAQQLYQTRSATLTADSSEAQTLRVRDAQINQAVALYVNALSLQEDIRANQALDTALQARFTRIQQRVNAGNALRSDALQIEVELNRLSQRHIVLESDLAIVEQYLARALDLSDAEGATLVGRPIVFEFEEQWLEELPWSEASSHDAACELRADCQALQLQIQALEAQRRGIAAEAAPNISLSYADTRSDGQLFVPEEDQRVLLEFSWSLFTGGARSKQRVAVAERIRGLQLQLRDLERLISIERDDVVLARKQVISALEVARQNVNLETERLRILRTRYDNGLITLDQLLDGEAGLIRAESEVRKASFQLLATWANDRLATGHGFTL